MKLIFISGPSGSGKTTLSNQILFKNKNGVVLSTDNYYKTGLLYKILSKIVQGYFDKSISFNYSLFRKDFNKIIHNGISIYERSYNFKTQIVNTFFKETKNIEYLIVEGIFAKEFARTLHNNNYSLIELKINKKECMNRAIKRDLNDRGKDKINAKRDFLKSWDIYYDKSQNKNKKEKINEFIFTKETNIDKLLEKIFNLNS